MTDLLLETATEVCGVGVVRDGRMLARVVATEVHQHASHLTLFIERALAEAGVPMSELDRVILSDGPGSYTSLRVGAATAKGLCLALPALELYTVGTLESLAVSVPPNEPFDLLLATVNSRRGEVYGQVFLGGGAQVAVSSPISNVRLTVGDWYRELLEPTGRLGDCPRLLVVGPGSERLREHNPDRAELRFGAPLRCSPDCLLTAVNQGRLLRREPAEYEPFYLNPPFVTTSRKKPLG